MKSIVTIFLCLFVFSFSFGQEMYWTVYNMEVDAGQEDHVMEAFQDFFESETGKNMPAAWLNSKMFSNAESDYNFQVGFSTTDKKEFGKMYSGYLNTNTDFKVLMHVLGDHSKPKGSYLGRSINFTPNASGKVNQVVALSIDDPAKYAAEFEKMTAAVHPLWDNKVILNLHTVMSGNEPDVSHLVVVSAPDFETMLGVNDMLAQQPAFQTFLNNVKDIRTIKGNTMTMNLMQFNTPSSTMAKK